jgi:gelsolin
MIKQKVYDLAGTNCESLGSDLEFQIKQTAAQHEDAWAGVGQAPGLKIWRIEKFHVKAWPDNLYGTFYSGDSYILLNTYKDEGNELHYDIHFWLGQNTSLDEAGTAAYKTVELDTFLDDKPVQHREVEGFESKLFLSYFKQGLYILEGGVDSGFFHVIPEDYKPRLLRVKGLYKHVHVRQFPLDRKSLNSGDVFLLDFGKKIYQFIGADAGVFEKHKASEVVANLKEKRGFHIDLIVLDQDSPTSDDEEFWQVIGGRGEIVNEPKDSDVMENKKTDLKLFRLSDKTGNLNFEFVAEGGAINASCFNSDDVFLLDKGYIIYIWIGKNSSREEKKSGMRYATKYIADNHENLPLPITVVPESAQHNVIPGLLRS